MPIPALLGLAAGVVGRAGVGQALAGGLKAGFGGKPRGRRRRRRGIPRKVLSDVAQVKSMLGQMAAKEVLIQLIAKG